MIDKKSLLKLFKEQNIIYNIFLHPPLFTVEESKKMRGKIKGAHTKNLFLKNKKNDFFLFSCLESTTIDLKNIKKYLNLDRLSFAGEKYLKEILNLAPGAVTPFGLLNDTTNKVSFFLDEKLMQYNSLNFHPLDNASTINIDTNIFLSFMKNNMKLVKIIDFDTYIIKNEQYS